MTSAMDYETMDWELEAWRVARAFGVNGECYFKYRLEPDGEESMWLRSKGEEPNLFLASEEWFDVRYTRQVKSYHVVIPEWNWAASEAEFSWDGELTESVFNECHALMYARGLLRLGLLTPAIEAELSALMVNHTAHERMEWKLEYDERSGL